MSYEEKLEYEYCMALKQKLSMNNKLYAACYGLINSIPFVPEMNNLAYSLLMDKKDPKVYEDSLEGRLKNADIQSEAWCTKGEVIGDIAQVVAPFAWAKLSKAGECVKVVEVASEGEKSVALAEEGIGAASKVEKTAEVTSKAGKITESGSGSVYDNLSPKTGTDWNNYFINKYGQENVHWNLNPVDDIWSDPTRMVGYSENEMASVLGDGWTRGAYGSKRDGWKFMKDDVSVFYHPSGGKHGGAYYGISSGATGKIKVVDPNTYIPLSGDKATIIYH